MAKRVHQRAEFIVYDHQSELETTDLQLIEAATQACDLAYAPYSGFRVGAAILLDDGQILKGANQENAAYPSGLCAERVAIFSLGATYPEKKAIKLAVVAQKSGQSGILPAPPCGSCRQVMIELENRQGGAMEVLFQNTEKKWVKSLSASLLLPFCFEQINLSS